MRSGFRSRRAVAPAGAGPHTLAFSHDGRWAFVAARAAGTVTVLDAATGAAVRQVKPGPAPTALAWSTARNALFVADEADGSVSVVDPAREVATVVSGVSAHAALLERAKAALDREPSIVLRDRIAVADYARHSRELRFHISDLLSGQSWSYLVAHGRGSDPDHSGFLQHFSNEEGSLASSAGAYRTGEMYEGQHGQSMRLAGLDATNDRAEPRAIVMHSAPYVTEDHIATWGKVGRSEGCFVVAPHRLGEVLALLGQGRLLYADKV